MCKPHKRGWDNRWKAKEQQAAQNAQQEMTQKRDSGDEGEKP